MYQSMLSGNEQPWTGLCATRWRSYHGSLSVVLIPRFTIEHGAIGRIWPEEHSKLSLLQKDQSEGDLQLGYKAVHVPTYAGGSSRSNGQSL